VKYPTDTLVQLKSIAEFFEKEFLLAKDDYTLLSNTTESIDELEYPYRSLQEDLHDSLYNIYSDYQEKDIFAFLVFLLTTYLTKERDSFFSGVGIYILLQTVVTEFSNLLLDLILHIKEKYMFKTENGNYIFTKPHGADIIGILALGIKKNPKISLYIWTEYIFPTILDPSSKNDIKELGIKYMEIYSTKYVGMGSYNKYPSGLEDESTISVPLDSLKKLIQFKFSENLKEGFSDIITKIINFILFSHNSQIKTYLEGLIELVAILDNEDMSLDILDILSKSLLRDAESRGKWLELYFLNIPASNNIIAYLITNWEEVLVYAKSVDQSKEEMLFLIDQFQVINEKLVSGEFYDTNNQVRSLKKLGLKTNDIDVVNSSCEELKKVINVHVTKTDTKGSTSTSLLLVSIIILLLGIGAFFFYTAQN